MIGVIKRGWLGAILSIAGLMMTITAQASENSEVQSLKAGSKELQHFRQLMRNNLTAWSFHKNDAVFDDAGADYTRRPDALFWDTAPPLQGWRGWAEYRHVVKTWIKSGIDQARMSLIDPEKFQGWRYRDVVWNIMHCGVSVNFASGDKADVRCRGTAIWEWEGDRWRLAHETFSSPVEPGQPVFQAERPDDPRIEPYPELLQRAKEMAEAWSNGSPGDLASRLENYYIKNENLTVYTPWPPFEVYQGWPAFEKGIEAVIGQSFRKINIRHNGDLEAQRRGKLAWSHATLHIETELPDGTVVPGDARQTLVWYLTDQGWRVVHEHFSFPQ